MPYNSVAHNMSLCRRVDEVIWSCNRFRLQYEKCPGCSYFIHCLWTFCRICVTDCHCPNSNQLFYYEYKDAGCIQDSCKIVQEIVYIGYRSHSWKLLLSVCSLVLPECRYLGLHMILELGRSISAVSNFLCSYWHRDLKEDQKLNCYSLTLYWTVTDHEHLVIYYFSRKHQL